MGNVFTAMATDPFSPGAWIAFAGISILTIAAAVGSVALRNLVHCGLCLAATLAGLAGLYLQLGAQFLGLAQVLVYIGAVAVLILFTVLLTRGIEPVGRSIFSSGWLAGLLIAVFFCLLLVIAVLASGVPGGSGVPQPHAGVREMGEMLMRKYVLHLQVAGVLLTAALIGAALIALGADRASRAMDNAGENH